MWRNDRLLKLFLDYTGGGAWPFLVGELICQVDSGNERDGGEGGVGLGVVFHPRPSVPDYGGCTPRKFPAITGL